MGKRGPVAKPAGRAQGHRKRQPALDVVVSASLVVPEPPEGLSAPVREAWETFWQSEIAQAVTDIDLPAVRRLFAYYEQHRRALEVASMELAVPGSKGQLRLNPLADYALKLEQAILRLETELGKTPLARSRLGIAVGQARLTLEEINRRASEGVSDGDVRDPRLALVDGASS
jgi:P27 family predicted phage terminase small subunit